MGLRRVRAFLGAYFSLFFVAVAAAPHHHLNGLQDLLLDQRSDSGDIVESAESGRPTSGSVLDAACLLKDIPCPACFMGDFVCNPTANFQFVAHLEPLPHEPRALTLSAPALLPASTSSRAPPRAS